MKCLDNETREFLFGTIGLSFDWIEEAFLSIPIKQLFKDTLTQNTEKLKKSNAK